jgi:hypothetical protein
MRKRSPTPAQATRPGAGPLPRKIALTELYPNWINWAPGKGISFDCPRCASHRIHVRFRENNQRGHARIGTSFETLTLMPELIYLVECDTGETVVHWRGWVDHGEVRSF